ncbi:MAG TPA: pilus assembly protein TadG-related protein, partial [Burkholderiaceae bacterium]|nr:pilus assembly protein TadG-related protein [Burkholderiaceae bacterium]
MGNAFGRLSAKLKRFVAANGGNVAMTFGLATLPIIGGVGAAIDFGHAHAVKSAMQSSLDATALMISREAAGLTDAELQTKVRSYFNAMFDKPEASSVSVAASYARGSGSQVVVTGSATVATSVMGIIGYNYIAINGSSTAKWGTQRLRVALALDTTGSMSSDGKMDALKSATKSLLTDLRNAATVDGDV